MSKAAISYTTGASRLTPDPVTVLIDAYRAGMSAYDAQATDAAERAGLDLEALAAETYEDAWDALVEVPAATTSAGAIAALDLALASGGMVNGEQAEALVRCARDFLVGFRASLDAAIRARAIADMPAPEMFKTILSRLLFVGGDSGMALLAFPVETVDLVRIMAIAAQNGVTPAAPAVAGRWQMLREEAIAYLGSRPEPRHVASGASAGTEEQQ